MKIIIDPGHSPTCVNGGKSGYKEHQGMWELSRHSNAANGAACGDVAFFQSTKETGWFRFGGQVLPQQNNFAGMEGS